MASGLALGENVMGELFGLADGFTVGEMFGVLVV